MLAGVRNPYGSKVNFAAIGVLIVSMMAGILLAIMASLGAHLYALVLAGGLVGLFLITQPTLMFPLLVLFIFLVDGLAQSVLGIGQVQWLISGLGLAILASYMLRLSRPANPPLPRGQSFVLTPISVATLVFFSILAASTAINRVEFGQLIVGLRSYVAMWGVFVFVAAGYYEERTVRRLFFALMVVAAIQWPFAIYQHFFVVAEREALRIFGSSWDSVVGSFGGSKFGGGQSSSLAIFLVVMVVLATSLLKHGLLRKSIFFALLCAVLLALGLAETKVIFVLIPFGLALLYRAEIIRRPVRAIGGALLMATLLALVLFSYHTLYWEGRRNLNTSDDIVERFTYSFKPDYYAAGIWPGRVTALNIWADKTDLQSNPVAVLIGHGAAAAVSSSAIIGQGELTRKYGVGLEASGGSKLLWETGLLGLVSFLLLPVAGYFCAGRALKRGVENLTDRAILEAVQASMPLLAIVVFYETTVVSVPPMQFLLMLGLGYAQYWYLKTRPPRR
ncbi:hypothetical protein [Methyloversatilis discipulorum]|uniref:hypothetical protein n=1 Tax=Methyloversatilis discipulorum TaxID=1119528 RepID=UPI001A55421E|nr:hypothetical protein [Methyloversatilis discipulorum]MBL8469179.1 hypothetical protein [Methyloversatilis discipulorum]